MRNGKSIIGVMGTTSGMQNMANVNANKISLLAYEVGKAITEEQHILLTGGKPSSKKPEPEHYINPIKDAAMDGAKYESSESKPARLISVLRKQGKYDIGGEAKDNIKHLIINTNFGDQRNFINGWVPDVTIAVHGGGGTLSELAFAHAAGVPIVFLQVDGVLDTLSELKKVTSDSKEREKFDTILNKTHENFPFFNIQGIAQQIVQHLNSPRYLAGSSQEAVEKAIECARSRVMYSFNSLPYYSEFITKLEEYETALNSLVA